MADKLNMFDCTCPICHDIFRDPVTLKCSHSFCQECLQNYWKDLKVLLCPVCRKECSSEEPTLSLAFKSLCESFKTQNLYTGWNDVCSLHGEKLKLFCFEENQPICVICHLSKDHVNHKCCPIQEAAEELKLKLRTGIETLEENLAVLNKAKEANEQVTSMVKTHVQTVEQDVRQQFYKFYQCLQAEETKWIKALREMEKRKCSGLEKNVAKLHQKITTVSDTIEMMKQEVEVENVTFLKNYSVNYERIQNSPMEPCAVPKVHCEDITPPGSLFTVWAQMKDLIQKPPVTLDPLTASNRLIVLDDGITVQYSKKKQPVPDNPERFYVGVLGSHGYTSGLHCWDVGVGDSVKWTLGVVEENVNRKVLLKMEPRGRFWSIHLNDGVYRAGVRGQSEIAVRDAPRIIRVWLDYDNGLVKFCDPHKNYTLYSFTCKFKEKVFPYFCSGDPECVMTLFPGKGTN